MKKITLFMVLALLLVGATGVMAEVIGTPSVPVSDGGVIPYIIDGKNPGGNRTCAEVGKAFYGDPNYYEFSSARVEYKGGFSQPFPTGFVVDTNGTYVSFTAQYGDIAVIVKGSDDANVYVYNEQPPVSDSGLASPVNASGFPAGLSNLTFCWNGKIVDNDPTLKVIKFYDKNTNGLFDADEVALEGWKVNVTDGVYTEDLYTPIYLVLWPGSFTVTEYMPIEMNWVGTTENPVYVELAYGDNKTVEFGNVCLGAGGGKTLGFWSNKNGQSFIGADDLEVLRDLNLRDSAGNHFDPATYQAFRTWLLDANATNMAYMLSAQLAAMKLNVYNDFVDGNALIYAPGTLSANANGFATVNAIIAEANDSLSLDGETLSGHPERSYQEALKNALDKANNNYTFVQETACPYTFAE
jgi:hypothetical protein